MGEDLPQDFGRYTLHELVGRGGMAEIYRASMPGIGGFEKTVAIKKILPHLAEDDDFTSMLIDEARIIESLDHANIAQVFDLGELEGTYYIAMEFIHGVDLAEIIEELERRGESFPVPHLTHIASSICAGLHFAHTKTDEQGEPLDIIHRDISPHNIRLSFAGEVKIIDFGVAKAADREAHTEKGVIKGKLRYMAPEQARAEELDGRADLFAAGLCAYKMLTGTLPFEGDTEFQIYNNILEGEIRPPGRLRSGVPPELNRIVMKLLRRDPAERYQSGYTAKQQLDELLHEISPGYTVNRLASWVEQRFSHLVQSKPHDAGDEASDVVPATPSRPLPGTGERDPASLDSEEARRRGGERAEERPVPVAHPDAETNRATPDADTSRSGEDPESRGPETRRATPAPDEQTDTAQPAESHVETTWPLYAIAGVSVGIAAMAAWAIFLRADPGPPHDAAPGSARAPEGPAPAGPSEAPELVRVSLASDPPEARLTRSGRPVGETPVEFELPRSDEPIEVTLSKPGFRDESIELVPRRDLERTIALSAAADSGAPGTSDGSSGSGADASVVSFDPSEVRDVGGLHGAGGTESEGRAGSTERREQSEQRAAGGGEAGGEPERGGRPSESTPESEASSGSAPGRRPNSETAETNDERAGAESSPSRTTEDPGGTEAASDSAADRETREGPGDEPTAGAPDAGSAAEPPEQRDELIDPF